MHIIFQTPRLILSQFRESEAPLILQLNSDVQVLKYVHEPVLQTTDEAIKIINEIIIPQYKKKLGRWAIYSRENMEFIGWCGLKQIPDNEKPENYIIDLGYRLIRSAWGKGYATEAAQYTLYFGFNNLNIELITARSHIDNTASIKILEKLGMKFVKEETVDDCPLRRYIIANPSLFSAPFL